jgi:hypothetical protein
MIRNTNKYHTTLNNKDYYYIDTLMISRSKSQIVLQSENQITKTELQNQLGESAMKTLVYPQLERIPAMVPFIFSDPLQLPTYVDRYNAVVVFNSLLGKMLTLQNKPDLAASIVSDYTYPELERVYTIEQLNLLTPTQLNRLRNLSFFTSDISPTLHEFVVPLDAISKFIDDFIAAFPNEMDQSIQENYDRVEDFLTNYDLQSLFPQALHTVIFLSRTVPFTRNENGKIIKFEPYEAIEIGEKKKLKFQKRGNAIFGYSLDDDNKFYIFDHALFYLLAEDESQLVEVLAQLVLRGIYGEGDDKREPLMSIFKNHELLLEVIEKIATDPEIKIYYQDQEELLRNSEELSKGHNPRLLEIE